MVYYSQQALLDAVLAFLVSLIEQHVVILPAIISENDAVTEGVLIVYQPQLERTLFSHLVSIDGSYESHTCRIKPRKGGFYHYLQVVAPRRPVPVACIY
jgi:hypothetical protein